MLSVVENPGDCGALDCLLTGNALWKTRLSIALCPHGCAPEVNLTQADLYARYDLMSALGITDTYIFLWNQIIPHRGPAGANGQPIAKDAIFWLNALARFRGHADVDYGQR